MSRVSGRTVPGREFYGGGSQFTTSVTPFHPTRELLNLYLTGKLGRQGERPINGVSCLSSEGSSMDVWVQVSSESV